MKKYPIIILLLMIFISSLHSQIRKDKNSVFNSWIPIKAINTKHHEFSMTISPDGKFMIFGSDRPGGLGDKDLWISYYKNDAWQKPVNLRILNSKYHDQEPFLTYDGNALLFTSDRDGGYGVGDIYISYRQGDKWVKPVNFGPIINTKDSEKMPSVSMDNKEIYFARIPVDYKKRKLKNKNIQIFVSKKKNNLWQKPQRMSYPVNKMSFDCAPRIMPDNRTLLFCSARDGGKGAYDIWRVKRKTPFDNWSGLSNVSSINTEMSEVHFAFTISGDRMYITSQRDEKNNYDIFEYKIKEEIADPTITLQGVVTNKKDGKPLGSKLIIELFNDKKQKFEIDSNKLTGKYSVTLPKGGDYSVTITSPGFLFHSRRLDLTKLSNSSITNVDVGLIPIEKGQSFVIRTIYFNPDSYELKDESKIALDKLVLILKKNPNVKLLIKGHVADIKAGKLDPQKLSKQRAETVKNYLINKDINKSRLKTKGYGSSKPIGDNKTEEGRKINRRTEFEVLSTK